MGWGRVLRKSTVLLSFSFAWSFCLHRTSIFITVVGCKANIKPIMWKLWVCVLFPVSFLISYSIEMHCIPYFILSTLDWHHSVLQVVTFSYYAIYSLGIIHRIDYGDVSMRTWMIWARILVICCIMQSNTTKQTLRNILMRCSWR